MRRYRRDRLVPVLDLDGMQGHLDNVAVRTESFHLDPVPDPDHVVTGDLYTRHERKDGVAENEQQDRGYSAESGEQAPGRPVDQRRYEEDRTDHVDGDLRNLGVGLDRTTLREGARRIGRRERRQERTNRRHADQDHGGGDDLLNEGLDCRINSGNELDSQVKGNRRRQVRQGPKNVEPKQGVVEFGGGLPDQATDHRKKNALGDKVGDKREKDNQNDADNCRERRILFEQVGQLGHSDLRFHPTSAGYRRRNSGRRLVIEPIDRESSVSVRPAPES